MRKAMFSLLKSLVEKLKIKFQWQKNNCSDQLNKLKLKNEKGPNTVEIDQSSHNTNNYFETSLSTNTIAELIDCLNILYEFLNFGGKLCHSLGEARCVTLSMYEGKADYSYAQRAQLFVSKGLAAAKKCRDLLSELPSGSATKEAVKKILNFLTDKESGKKDTLGRMEQSLISKMEGDRDTECRSYADKISELSRELDDSL